MTAATPRRQLNVRLPPDLIKQIETDGRSKQDVVEAALREWFDDSKVLSNTNKKNGGVGGDDSIMIATLTHQLGEKDRQITELHVMLQTAISPQLQLPPAPDAKVGRKWWQFWRQK